MSNPIYQEMGNMPMGNMGQMLQEFNRFRQSFQGDPKAEVDRLLQSGKMSQAQLNQLQAMAQQLQAVLTCR
ncbi:MAG: hypothetical protein LUE22_06495 [Oscillospiraceae bacterium]|nr:hypothetical protein [Oscillospiraceae bacterium]